MKKSDKDLIKSTLGLHQEMNSLTVDEINQTPSQDPEPQIKLSKKEIAKMEGVLYIEPKRTLPAVGTLPESQKKIREHDWEYVKGIFENLEINGEPIKFWYVKYAGDRDCLWEIPCNVPVYVPRMIAKHLEEGMKYHKFDFLQKPEGTWRPDEFTHQFAPTSTFYRGKFRPIGAFS